MIGCSIVLCAHNSEKVIGDTIRCIAEQEIDFPTELIFVDNASSDNTARIAKYVWKEKNSPFKLCIIREEKLGKGNALHTGFTAAKNEVIVFVDDDNRLCTNYLKQAVKLFLEMPELGVAGGVLDAEFEVPPPFWFERWKALYAIGCMKPVDSEPQEHSIYGAGMCMRAAAWQKILDAGYQPQVVGRSGLELSSGSDYEYCKLIKLAGWKLYSSSSLKLRHFMSKERLNWEYFLKLCTGISSSYVEIIGLHNAIVLKEGNLKDRLLTSWWIYRIKKQLKDWVLTLKKGPPTEGSESYVNWLKNREELKQIKLNKAKYESMVRQLTNPTFMQKISRYE